MVQLEVKLRIKHERGSRGRRGEGGLEGCGSDCNRGRKGEKREEETGGERFTLFPDQRTEYRLERRKKGRNTENREQALEGVRLQDADTMASEREETQTQASDFAGGARVHSRFLLPCVTEERRCSACSSTVCSSTIVSSTCA